MGVAKNILINENYLTTEAESFKQNLISEIINNKKNQLNNAIENDIKNKKIENDIKIKKNIFIFINPSYKFEFSEALIVGKNKIQEKKFINENFNIIIKHFKV